MIQTLCNGKCHIDPECAYHNPVPITFTYGADWASSKDKTAVRCPVCDGRGNIPDENMRAMTAMAYKGCHGCLGKGWVVV